MSAPTSDPVPAPSAAKALLRDSGVYLLGNLMQKAAALLLIPLYTNRLSTAQYGLLELANTLVNLLLLGAALGVPSAINKCFHRDCPDDAARRRLAGTAILFSVAAAGGLALLGWALEDRIAPLLFSGSEGPLVYRFALVWMVLGQLAQIPFELLRTRGRSHLFVSLSLTQLLVQSSCTLFLVLRAGWGLRGVLAGNLCGLVVVNLAGLVMIAPQTRWKFDGRLFARMAAYGLAMIPVFVSGWIVNLSDRFFLQWAAGLGVLGVYALGYKFGNLVDMLVVMPFQRAWTPIFFRMSGEPVAPLRLARVTTYLTALLVFLSLAISLAVPPFLRLTAAAEFQGAGTIVPLVCLAYLLAGLTTCLSNGLIVAEKVRLVAGYAAIAAVAKLALNALLIPRLGMYGAAAATAAAFGAQLIGTLRSLRRHYPVPLEWGRLLGVAVVAAGLLACASLLPSMPALLDIAARGAMILLFPPLVWLLRLVRPHEAQAVAHALALLRARLRRADLTRGRGTASVSGEGR